MPEQYRPGRRPPTTRHPEPHPHPPPPTTHHCVKGRAAQRHLGNIHNVRMIMADGVRVYGDRRGVSQLTLLSHTLGEQL